GHCGVALVGKGPRAGAHGQVGILRPGGGGRPPRGLGRDPRPSGGIPGAPGPEKGALTMSTARHSDDEAQIAALLDAYAAAIHAKDARAAIALYTRDVVAFDLAPPLRIDAATERDPRNTHQWFDTWDGPTTSQGRARTA